MDGLTRERIAIAAIGLVLGACDPIRVVSASKPIPAPLAQACVVEALRTEKAVRTAGVSDAGRIYAELIIPENLKSPESHPVVGVEESRNNHGELEINFSILWVGAKGSPEYREYVRQVIEQLRDRTIERCAGR
jgi:hypothetical protein